MDRITTPNGVGGDRAEDVFGGLDAMLQLNWPPIGTKVLSNNSVRCISTLEHIHHEYFRIWK